MRCVYLCVWCTVGDMLIDWSDEFDAWWNRVEAAAKDKPYFAVVYAYVLAALELLGSMDAAPTADDRPTLVYVLESRQYPLWRISHPYRDGYAVRVVVWFTDHAGDPMAFVVLAGDKAKAGNTWYHHLGAKADRIINRWLEGMEQ